MRLQNMEDPDDVDDVHSYLLRQPVIHSLAKVSSIEERREETRGRGGGFRAIDFPVTAIGCHVTASQLHRVAAMRQENVQTMTVTTTNQLPDCSVYETARSLQGRLNDLLMLTTTHLRRHPSCSEDADGGANGVQGSAKKSEDGGIFCDNRAWLAQFVR